MIILGVTGSMAMGKSTVTQMLHQVYNIPFWDADQEVRTLLVEDEELIQEISKRYPSVLKGGKIDRELLRALAFGNETCLTVLESLIHPRALDKCKAFLKKMQNLNMKICALDVPLLFEVGWDKVCTHTLMVTAPAFVQRQRLQKRGYMSEENVNHLLSRQWSLDRKRKLATYEIKTGLSKANTLRQLNQVMLELTANA